MNMSKSRDIQAKMPSPKVIFYAFWLVTVKVLNSSFINYICLFDYLFISFYIFLNVRKALFYRLYGHFAFVVNLTYLGLSSYIFAIKRG